MDLEPHKYQARVATLMVEYATLGLLLPPGMGKTVIVYMAFEALRAKGIVKTMIVIAPLRPAYGVWPEEAEKWNDFKGLKVAVLHGPHKEALLNSGADVFVINPEGLPWLFERRSARSFDMLVVDESTKFKHTNTQRFKILRPQLPYFARRYILTGTPAPNGIMDLFGQIFILDLGRRLGQWITHYRRVYFNSVGFGGFMFVPKAGAQEQIERQIDDITVHLSAEDHLSLPPLIFNKIEVELPPDARNTYNAMEKLFIAEWDSGTIKAANGGVASQKCRQIANGGLYSFTQDPNSPPVRSTLKLHDAKTDAVEDLVEELSGKPALVCYEFEHDRERLQARLGADVPYIGGGVPPKRFKEIERDWNAGKIPVLLAQPQSVAHGLNLQGTGAAIIRHSQIWDLELVLQFLQRVWRQGQKEAVVVHDIVARRTIDTAIRASNVAKDHKQNSLLNALKGYVKSRKGGR